MTVDFLNTPRTDSTEIGIGSETISQKHARSEWTHVTQNIVVRLMRSLKVSNRRQKNNVGQQNSNVMGNRRLILEQAKVDSSHSHLKFI